MYDSETIEEAIAQVVNQSRYTLPFPEADVNADEMDDDLYNVMDDISDEQALYLLVDKPLLSTEKITALIKKIGVKRLFRDDGAIDEICDYVCDNRADLIDMQRTTIGEYITTNKEKYPLFYKTLFPGV